MIVLEFLFGVAIVVAPAAIVGAVALLSFALLTVRMAGGR